jgi:hypothetical protein
MNINIASKFGQWTGVVIGGIIGAFEATMPYIFLVGIAIALDVFSAFMLSRRVRRLHPSHCEGKFRSSHVMRVIVTFGVVYAVMIIGAYVDDLLIDTPGHQALNAVIWAFVFYEAWSCLENWSSANGSRWARLLQRIMVDKISRHLDVQLPDMPDEPLPDNNESKRGRSTGEDE